MAGEAAGELARTIAGEFHQRTHAESHPVPAAKFMSRGMADLFPAGDPSDADQALAARMAQSEQEDRPLRVKLGIDPTGSNIHLGHSILFRKLRAFQDAGHTAVLIIGDFTARIGDPTGKSATRVQLTKEQVCQRLHLPAQSLGQDQPKETALLDFETPAVWRCDTTPSGWRAWTCCGDRPARHRHRRSDAGKDDFSKRYGSGTPIALHEFLYPLLQGYDSVAVNADVEAGRHRPEVQRGDYRDLQRHFDKGTQFGLLLPILVGLDGVQKMSKSLGNVVGLEEDPLSMYSNLEKVGDAAIDDYVTLLTDLDLASLPENPREKQKAMALAVTASRHGFEAAQKAQRMPPPWWAVVVMLGADVPEASLAEVNFRGLSLLFVQCCGDLRQQQRGPPPDQGWCGAFRRRKDHRPQSGVRLSGGTGGQGAASG